MDANQFQFLSRIPQMIMDDSITEYMGFNPEKNCEECIVKKKDGDIWLHSSVYSLLEENEVMDDLMDVILNEKMFHNLIIFDDREQSIIRLDY